MTEHGSPINIPSLPFDSFYFFGVYPFVYFWIFFWSFSRTIRNAIIGFVFIIIDISGEFLCQRNPLKQITLVRLPLGRRHISNGRKKPISLIHFSAGTERNYSFVCFIQHALFLVSTVVVYWWSSAQSLAPQCVPLLFWWGHVYSPLINRLIKSLRRPFLKKTLILRLWGKCDIYFASKLSTVHLGESSTRLEVYKVNVRYVHVVYNVYSFANPEILHKLKYK